jgi:hypothetical protein
MDLSAIGQQFGLSPQQTQAAFDALAPVIASGMRQNGNASGGLGGILEQMLNGGVAQEEDITRNGNDVLGEIFGSKDVSRGVANHVSAQTGIGATILKKMLPIIATMVMAQLAKGMMGGGARAGQPSGGGLGDILGDILGGGGGGMPQQRQQRPAPSGGDVLGGDSIGRSPSQGGGGLGDILGDILGGAQGGGQRQAPGGFGDILKDVLGGGASQPSSARSPADILLEQLQRGMRG